MRARLRARRLGATLLAALGVAASLSSCGISNAATSVAHKSTLVIGVKGDQPGLGLKQSDGSFSGFDVDIATYVAQSLGAKHIVFKQIDSKHREAWLADGTVDMVVATYSITPVRKTQVLFGGPYYLAHQDTLVLAKDIGTIRTVHDLAHRKLCDVSGSNSFSRVVTEKKIPAVEVDSGSYATCVQMLLGGQVQAVSTDDLILAGFAKQYAGQLKLIRAPFSDEKYGIGIKKGDVEGCEDINKAITNLYQQQKARPMLEHWFSGTGLEEVDSVPQFEGCS